MNDDVIVPIFVVIDDVMRLFGHRDHPQAGASGSEVLTVAAVAAWGGPVARVEVSVDGGAWQAATLEEGVGDTFAWTLWSLPWGTPGAGEHTIVSRAIDAQGRIQSAMDDPLIANKLTYWESNGQITRRVRIG